MVHYIDALVLLDPAIKFLSQVSANYYMEKDKICEINQVHYYGSFLFFFFFLVTAYTTSHGTSK